MGEGVSVALPTLREEMQRTQELTGKIKAIILGGDESSREEVTTPATTVIEVMANDLRKVNGRLEEIVKALGKLG